MASIYKRGNIFWICYRYGGKSFDESLKTKNKKIALYKKLETENKLNTGTMHVPDLAVIHNKIHTNPWIITRWGNMNDKERQAILFFLFNGRCFHCQTELRLPLTNQRNVAKKLMLIMDHAIPFSCGGSDMPNNLIASCYECNLKRSQTSIEEFKKSRLKNPAFHPETKT